MPLLEGAVRAESAQARAAQCVTSLGLETKGSMQGEGRTKGPSYHADMGKGLKATPGGVPPIAACTWCNATGGMPPLACGGAAKPRPRTRCSGDTGPLDAVGGTGELHAAAFGAGLSPQEWERGVGRRLAPACCDCCREGPARGPGTAWQRDGHAGWRGGASPPPSAGSEVASPPAL